MDYTLVIDEGTTSTRAIIFDENGSILSSSGRQLKAVYPHIGWVEQDPQEIFSKTVESIEDAIFQCGCTPKYVGVTNQRETIVAWDDRDGRPLYNAIVWRDKRGQELCERLKSAGYEPLIRAKTGLLLDPYFSASKIAWMIRNVEEVKTRVGSPHLKFGTIDSYLVWKLTGNHFTEPSNASRTLLFDIDNLKWDKDLLEIFGIPFYSMPEVINSNGDFGNSRYGKIVSVLGDQQSSLMGNVCVKLGEVKCTYGTGAFVLVNAKSTKNPPFDGLLKTIAWSVNGVVDYAFEGSVLSSGEVINWLKRISLIKDEMEVEELARSTKSDGIYFVPALDGLGSPRWTPGARALFIGMNSSHARSNMIRAVIESMAFSVAEVIDTFKKSGLSLSTVRVDGGGSKNSLLVQILADVTKLKVERAKFHEMTAYGAFLMSKIKGDLGDVLNLKKEFDLFEPSEDLDSIYKKWQMAEDLVVKW